MKRTVMSIALAAIALVSLAAFGTYKGAILGGTEARYPLAVAMSDFHSLTATTLDGETFDFTQLKGKRVLIVNTASRCGCLLYTSPSPRDLSTSRMPSSA